MTAVDVVGALNVQNFTLPTGIAKIGPTEYSVGLNGSPATLAEPGDIPIRSGAGGGATIALRDLAHVRDGFQPETNIVRPDGPCGRLLSVLKNGGASQLDIIEDVKALLPKILKQLPEGVDVTPLLDQSAFVRTALAGVPHETPIAAGLTVALILLFLGNWRSTLIISVSIPLSATRMAGPWGPATAAGVSFYGGQPPAGKVARIKAPLLLHHAEADERINAGWPAFEAALEAAGVAYEAHTYPGVQHGFNNNNTTPRYDAESADLAGQRAVAFFRRTLAA